MTTRRRLNIVSFKRLDYWQAHDISKHHWITEWKNEQCFYFKKYIILKDTLKQNHLFIRRLNVICSDLNVLLCTQVSVVSDPGRRGHNNTLSPFPSPFRSPFRSPLRCSPFKNLGHATGNCALDLDCDDDDMNLGCFILMFDLILKQVTNVVGL